MSRRRVRSPRIGRGLLTVGVIALVAAACGDDTGTESAGSPTTEAAPGTTAVAVEFDAAFCEAFGDAIWVEFATADQRTEEQAARMETLSAVMTDSAPDSLSEEVAAMQAGTEAIVETWRAAGFDPAAVDTSALTDVSTEASDSVHRIEGLAEDGCDIPRGQGGLFATG